jgi:hypothetical protein
MEFHSRILLGLRTDMMDRAVDGSGPYRVCDIANEYVCC